ncbi:phosphoribosylanthranilate isomerase [Arthrobacter sp. TWP1-1]|uniref:phosphoribosylanthranilate isomerase n=1 Tax=Arthrobacter sp. TWP1-1 TaxID=2804568 RepID=UPI003CF98814
MTALYVKICGLQNAETVSAAVEAGADAIGFIFAPGSPRTVTAGKVATLIGLVPQGVETVGVFRNQPLDEVVATARAAQVTTVQLHGDETLGDMQRLHEEGFRTLRAFSVEAYSSLDAVERRRWASERILLDAVEPGAGVTFDASALEGGWPHGFWLLAGGLNPANVGALITELAPSGVDVSSGVESSRGVKDVQLIRDFIHAVRSHRPLQSS